VGKCTAEQDTDDNMAGHRWQNGGPQMAIWRMRIACWIPKATNTHDLLLFHGNNGYANAPQCHVIRTVRGLYFWLVD
jgi:hypothetical protein